MQWLITGCSSGFGLSLARAVLRHPNQHVIATSRNPSSSPEAVAEITSHSNGTWATLDVSSPNLESQLSTILDQYGPIDVLINNAGFGVGGVLEDMPLDLMRSQYETNFFGPMRLMKAVIPGMRQAGRGTIVNISSSVFWDPHASVSMYASSKWALEGVSEALAEEVASFGIRVLIAQPGAMRTSFVDPEKVSKGLRPLPDAYKGTMADYVLQAIVGSHGVQSIDPEAAAGVVVEEVLRPSVMKDGEGKEVGRVLRLQLGKDCVGSMHAKMGKLALEGGVVEEKALSCNYET
ncbi:hypothetical protein OHC33_010376 [Knufia fluminis]|uniref:Uncharacterized protein n=2 Tax=Knufia TaxID=430999 RepID=A0AAN8I1B8_9EURO|nr:hypothetical protein OHC33_010376 [Knufia fluminis]